MNSILVERVHMEIMRSRYPQTAFKRVADHLVSFRSCVFVCFIFLRSVSCVPNVACVSGLSILGAPFGFLCRLLLA
jgi:hypothetical protein